MATWEVLLTDLATDDTLVDLSNVFSSASVAPKIRGPRTATAIVAGDNAGIRAIHTDGLRKLVSGKRGLKIRRDGTLWAHTRIWDLDGNADENSSSIAITGFDPLTQLFSRFVRDATGDLTLPDFGSPISGAAIIKQAIENSITYDGPLPIDTTSGTFDETIPPAVDLAAQLTNWPITIADLINLLARTGVLDVRLDPVDTSLGADPGILVALSVVNRAGSDLSGSVHFDFATGDYSVQRFRFTESMGNQQSGGGFCNKLWYELGPRKDEQHWAGNITATETTPEDLSAYLALEEASRDDYGVFHDIRIFDSYDENTARKMWHELWKREVVYRVTPRQLAYITPHAGVAPDPLADYDIFDTVAINAADLCGPELVDAAQRVYGYTASKEAPDSVERVSQLLTLTDDA